jgi:hypothetical protein
MLASRSLPPTTEVVVPPIKARNSGLLYRVQEGRKWGYMNRRGEMVIPPRFDRAEDFFERKAAVTVDGQAGYIDESGDWLIEPRFTFTRSFQDGAGIVSVGRFRATVIDKLGASSSRVFFLVEDFSDGFAAVWDKPIETPRGNFLLTFGGLWGFVNSKGAVAIEPRFDRVKRFTEGLAAINANVVWDREAGAALGGKWGFINSRRETVIPPIFDDVKPFYSGVAVYWDAHAKLFGLINKKGAILLRPTYTAIGSFDDSNPFHDGLARAERHGRLPSYLRPAGTVAFECACGEFSEGLASIDMRGRVGYVNTKGATVIAPAFDEVRQFSEGLAAVRKGQTWGYADKKGNLVIAPRFETAHPFVDGLALAEISHARWAYIDTKGQVVRDKVWDGAN